MRSILLAAALALGTLFAQPATAAEIGPCAPLGDLLAKLAGDPYYEVVIFAAVDNTGRLRLITADPSPDDSSWTLIVAEPHGTACLTAAGTDWDLTVPPTGPAPDEGDPL